MLPVLEHHIEMNASILGRIWNLKTSIIERLQLGHRDIITDSRLPIWLQQLSLCTPFVVTNSYYVHPGFFLSFSMLFNDSISC